MITTVKLKEIVNIIEKYKEIEYRIINNTFGKNLILLNKNNQDLTSELLATHFKYIQEIVYEDDEKEDELFIKQIKNLCSKNNIIHKNTSYTNWNRSIKNDVVNNLVAGYSFKGGMGRSSTLAYLAYLYYLTGKKIVVLDFDFEAPGIASLFFNKSERESKAGILDYFIDLNLEEELKLDDYFLQFEVSDKSGNLYLFPSGIDYDIENYINKISKIDFNSDSYRQGLNKLLNNINKILKPDLIFIDLRAGINESNGLVLLNLSSTNLLFFNVEEQNEDGIKAISKFVFSKDKRNFILNSMIRFQNSEIRAIKEKQFKEFITRDIKLRNEIVNIGFEAQILENKIEQFKNFIETQFSIYQTNKDFYLGDLFQKLQDIYFEKAVLDDTTTSLIINEKVDIETIFQKLEITFNKLTGTESFKDENSLKYFYLKDDIAKIVNEQIFLILGAKGSGKSSLYEVFTKHHKDILKNLNLKNVIYTPAMSKQIIESYNLSKDTFQNIYDKSNNEFLNIERFWKSLTLFQLENYLNFEEKYFSSIDEIIEKFTIVENGIEIDKKLKYYNIQLLHEDRVVTLVYDELDVAFPNNVYKVFIEKLVSFWQENIYKYSQIRSKILLRNDIYDTLNIENKTHLDLNKYELKWSEKEILSLILKMFITVLNEDELEKIKLLNIVKNKKNKEVVEDEDEIKNAIYLIFDKQLAKNRPPMDKWIMTRLSDAKDLVTPRVIYKFLWECIKKELRNINSIKNDRKHLFTVFSKFWEEILKTVSLHKLDEYNEEYKSAKSLQEKIKKFGQRSFSFEEYKKLSSNKVTDKTLKEELNDLIESGFIAYDDRQKKYQVAYIYAYGLDLKINKSKTGLSKKN